MEILTKKKKPKKIKYIFEVKIGDVQFFHSTLKKVSVYHGISYSTLKKTFSVKKEKVYAKIDFVVKKHEILD